MQLGSLELESAIETELAENPALERISESEEPVSQEEILAKLNRDADISHDYENYRSRPDGDDTLDWLDFASSRDSLQDVLAGQLLADAPPAEVELYEILIGAVNERGYLGVPLEEIALQTNVSLEEAEAALQRLQACEPAGVGARNVAECLYLQLRGDDSLEAKIARSLLKNNMDYIVHRNAKAVARQFSVTPQLAEAAFELVSSLTPYPGDEYEYTGSGSKPSRAQAEIVFDHTPSGWEITVRGIRAADLRVSRAYSEQMAALKGKHKIQKAEYAHVKAFVQRAEVFISALEQRAQTLLKIADHLIRTQGGFIQTGQFKFLNDLTRLKLAREIGVHESTISRATMEKCVQIATGEIVSFDIFFDSSLKASKMIEEILQYENPNSPLSDARIAQMLEAEGVTIARRTVNKYRDKTRLLSSRKRKSA